MELDFQYPSEGIHRRWDAGYRITSCAATPDQSALVLRCVCVGRGGGCSRGPWSVASATAHFLLILEWPDAHTHAQACSRPLPPPPSPTPPPTFLAHCSVPKRRPMDETQETLRTSAFPSTHVKEKWAKNLYIAGVAYGRTVS